MDLDEIGLFNPELRPEIAFNPSSEHIPVTRAAGITTMFIAGTEVSLESRHTREYDKWMKRAVVGPSGNEPKRRRLAKAEPSSVAIRPFVQITNTYLHPFAQTDRCRPNLHSGNHLLSPVDRFDHMER